MKVLFNLSILIIFTIFGVWIISFFPKLHVLDLTGVAVYTILDILPDLLKILIMIYLVILYINPPNFIFNNKSEFRIFKLFFPFLIFFVWRGYFIEEVNSNIWEWFINIPELLFVYVSTHILTCIISLAIFICLIFSFSNSFEPNSSDSDCPSGDGSIDYAKYDNDGFLKPYYKGKRQRPDKYYNIKNGDAEYKKDYDKFRW